MIAGGCIHVVNLGPSRSIIGGIQIESLGPAVGEISVLPHQFITGDPEWVGELPGQEDIGQFTLIRKPTITPASTFILVKRLGCGLIVVSKRTGNDTRFRGGGGSNGSRKIRGQWHGIFERCIIPNRNGDLGKVTSIGVGRTHTEGENTPGSRGTGNHSGGRVQTHPGRGLCKGVPGGEIGGSYLVTESHSGCPGGGV